MKWTSTFLGLKGGGLNSRAWACRTADGSQGAHIPSATRHLASLADHGHLQASGSPVGLRAVSHAGRLPGAQGARHGRPPRSGPRPPAAPARRRHPGPQAPPGTRPGAQRAGPAVLQAVLAGGTTPLHSTPVPSTLLHSTPLHSPSTPLWRLGREAPGGGGGEGGAWGGGEGGGGLRGAARGGGPGLVDGLGYMDGWMDPRR